MLRSRHLFVHSSSALLLALCTLAGCRGTSEPSPTTRENIELRFPNERALVSPLLADWSNESLGDGVDQARADALVTQYQLVNTLSALDTDIEGGPTRLEEFRALSELASGWIVVHGESSFMALGSQTFETCQRELVTLLLETSSGGDPLPARIERGDDPQILQVASLCGGLLESSLEAGIISPTGAIAVSPEELQLLYRRRWAALLHGHLQYEELVPADEVLTFRQWSWQSPFAGDVETREQRWRTFRDAGHSPRTFPASYADAVFSSLRGDRAASARELEEALGADPGLRARLLDRGLELPE